MHIYMLDIGFFRR